PFRELLLRHTNEHRYAVAVQMIAQSVKVIDALVSSQSLANEVKNEFSELPSSRGCGTSSVQSQSGGSIDVFAAPLSVAGEEGVSWFVRSAKSIVLDGLPLADDDRMLATKSTTAKQTRSGGFVESHALPSAEMIESYFLGDGNTFWVDDDNIPAPSFGLPPPPTSAYVISQPSFDGAAFDLFDIAEDVVAVLELPQGTTDYHRNAQPEVWSPQRGQGPRVVWKADSHRNSDVGGGGRQQSTFYAEEATLDTELITFGSFISDADGEKDNVPSVPQLIFEHAALPPQGETSLHWALGDDFELESAASIDAVNFGQSVGRVRLHQPHRALSPPELSDASDDMDDWLLRHLPTHGIGLSFRDMLSGSDRDNSRLQASSSLPLPFSAEELQQLLTGTMDLHALFGDDDDLVFSPPQQSAEHSETQLLMTVPGPKAGHRRSTTLNAVGVSL
ncbi:Hypothetical protein, putative, partial [Bodo saltans]